MKMDPPEAAKHIFYEVRPGWTDQVSPGDIVLAGKNFGLGSSRPVAALFTELGVAGLVAEEFNSLFFRNAVNAGLPAMTVPNATSVFQRGRHRNLRSDRRQLAQRHHGSLRYGPSTARPDPRHHRKRRRHAPAGGAGLSARPNSATCCARAPSRCAAPEAAHDGRYWAGCCAALAPASIAARWPAAALPRPESITVTSSAFADGDAMPASCAGKGVGDNTSPPLRWDGLPPETRQVVLIIDDVDVPLPRPLLHTVAVIDPTVDSVAAGSLQPGAAGMRFIRADLGHRGYAGPRPIPGHGPHRLPISRVRDRRAHRRHRHLGQGSAGAMAGQCWAGHVTGPRALLTGTLRSAATGHALSRASPRAPRARSRRARCARTCPTGPANPRAATAHRRGTPWARWATPSA